MAISLDSLNEKQREAVLKTDGPLMLLAGAGSGKTRTLVAKICHLLDEVQVSPFKILAVTFSNKAAREMRERVSSETNLDIGALQITTFHSFCAYVLRNEYTYLGLSRNFTIYDASESKTVAKTILTSHGINLKETSPFELLNFIEEIKNNGFYQGRECSYYEPDETDIFFQYYLEYENEIHRSNAVDFGGLITGVLQLFEKHPEILKKYQNRYEYILVDEYQDTNKAQFELIRLLSETRKNVCVVGDEDQSIYSWRGADIRNILDFEQYYPNAQVIKLEQNYRSSQTIIEAASHVISQNRMRKGKNMWTDNDQGEAIQIVESESDKDEALFVGKKIKELAKKGVELREIAVFYRGNAQSRLIEDQLRQLNVSYRVVGGIKFYERKEVKDLLAYLRLIVNSKDSLALARIINTPTRGIGATSLRKLENEAASKNLSLWELLVDIVENSEEYSHLRLSRKIKASLGGFVSLIQEVKLLDEHREGPSVIYDKVYHESGYHDFLSASKDYESVARLENLEELHNAIAQFEQSTQLPTLTGFLESITLDTESEHDEGIVQTGEVSLMTVHGSKGLEFQYVFVVGVEENLFPSYKSMELGEVGLEEERRLFYVAMTRAMKKLYLCFAQGRLLFGQLKFNGPSCFLDEIPKEFYEWNQKGFSGKRSSNKKENKNTGDYIDYSSEYSQEATDNEMNTRVISKKVKYDPKYPVGTLIKHGVYGEGVVLETDGIGHDEKVLIQFNDGAKKKFMVKFAPIEFL